LSFLVRFIQTPQRKLNAVSERFNKSVFGLNNHWLSYTPYDGVAVTTNPDTAAAPNVDSGVSLHCLL